MKKTMITFAALAHALYRVSKGQAPLEHHDDAAEQETALVALRAALQAQGIDVQLEGTHRVPDATEIAALTPERRPQVLAMGLSLALSALRPHVQPLGRQERKRQLEEHRDLIVRVADAVILAAATYLRYPAEEIELLKSASTDGPVTIPILLPVPRAEDRATFAAWQSVLQHVIASLTEVVSQSAIHAAMQRIDANDPGLRLIGVTALDHMSRALRDEPHVSDHLQDLREEAPGEHKIPPDIDAQIVVLLALTRQRDLLAKYLGEEGTVAVETPDRAAYVACLEGATDGLSRLRPASRDLRRALNFLRSHTRTRITH